MESSSSHDHLVHPLAVTLIATLMISGCRQDPTSPSAPELGPSLATVAATRTLNQISSGGLHTCGVASDGRAYCWGYNAFGQLGDGTTTDRHAPVAVAGGLRFTHVSAGTYHTCGATTDDRVFCWGINDQGQLGDGSTARRL